MAAWWSSPEESVGGGGGFSPGGVGGAPAARRELLRQGLHTLEKGCRRGGGSSMTSSLYSDDCGREEGFVDRRATHGVPDRGNGGPTGGPPGIVWDGATKRGLKRFKI
jgi:hypothetical protein